jgi:DNA polymerase III epsilon subunit-like protein|uniref:Exonuclease domain-containing protein n=1 Tax=viral metagenome TaxID=1070528 RepID=A0A6C0JK35_9ZZZZ
MTTIKIYAPIRKRMIVVFDVETTGLIPKKIRGQEIPIESYPYIIQLSCVVYDIFEKRIVKSFDSYVKISDNIEISEKVTELTGITRELCNKKGKNIIDVLECFYEMYMLGEVIIAHNIEFDEKMILIELERNRTEVLEKIPHCFSIFNKIYEKLKGVERYCTMRYGTELCNILVPSKIPGGNPTKKWPRLNELHEKLFNEVPEGLHNSLVDVHACLRCYLKMRHGLIN